MLRHAALKIIQAACGENALARRLLDISLAGILGQITNGARASHRTTIRLRLPCQNAHGRRLARAVAADEANAVAGLHAEVLPGGVEKRARSYPDFEIIGYNHEEIV